MRLWFTMITLFLAGPAAVFPSFATDNGLRKMLSPEQEVQANPLALKPGLTTEAQEALPGIDPASTGSIAITGMPLRGAVEQSLLSSWNWQKDSEMRGPIQAALDRSDALRASISDIDIARARSLRAMAAFLPLVSGSVTTQLYTDGQSSSNADTYTTAGINFSMPLFAGGQNWNALKSAKSGERAAKFEARNKAESVILDVLSAQIELEFAGAQLEIAKSNVATLSRLRTSVSKRIAAGISSAADLADIDANVALAERQLETARAAQQAATSTIMSTTGREAASGITSLAELEGLLAGGKSALIFGAKHQNSMINAARERAQAAYFGERAAIGKYLPRIDLNGEYARVVDQNSAGSVDPNRIAVQVRLRVPLVDFNTLADVKEAKALALQADYRARDTAHLTERQIIADWDAYSFKAKQAALAGKQVSAAKRSLDSRRKQFEAGLISADSVATQAQNLAGANLAQAQVKAERQMLMLRMAASAGLIRPE